jgi:DNA-binding NarL/FixJ family response regulator
MNVAVNASSYNLGQSQALQLPFAAKNADKSNQERRLPLGQLGNAKISLALISKNIFFGTCLTRCLQEMTTEFAVDAYENLDEWRQASDQALAQIVVLCAIGQKETDATVHQGLETLLKGASDIRAIVISDVEHPSQMIAALERGAKGYVPMSLDIEVVVGAIRLVQVGGTFVPASGLSSLRPSDAPEAKTERFKQVSSLLTERQLAVLKHLRQGDQNKTIAHKLNMSEATVKIHVRNMMKRVGVKNRTELVFMTNRLL